MKRKLIKLSGVILTVMLLFVVVVTPASALISYPDSDPTVIKINAYRNVLETGDFLILVYENTPYASTPAVGYSEAYVWRLYDTAGTTEYAQSLGFSYNSLGYGYNVIAFYLDVADLTALGIQATYWQQPFIIKLSGTFGVSTFLIPRSYSFPMSISDYSALTATAEVKDAIALRLIEIATDLDNQWGLTATYSLLYSGETSTTLSIYGQAFFRGAIYGVQSMAPSIFPLAISNVDTDTRAWTQAYATNLTGQYAGGDLATATAAGQTLFAVNYNLMGILMVLVICAFIVGANWRLSGGNLYKGLLESVPVLVIGSRLALVPLGEMGLIVALCWLYISAKVWNLI